MTVFHDLLRVQEHDTAADQLRHRRQTLPERAALRTVEDELARLEASASATGLKAAEAGRIQRAFEDELSMLEAKLADLDSRLYSGTVTVPRELQAMQAESGALRARRAALEDDVLAAMEVREPLDAEVAALDRRRAELDAEGARLRAALAEAEAQIDEELAGVLEARPEAAASVPADMAARYERLRARLDGVGAAPLVHGRCGGCHLALSATEVDRLRKLPEDELVTCEQCERILVRP